jgi:hypothetical protein
VRLRRTPPLVSFFGWLVWLAAALHLRKSRVLFIMAKRYPVRNSQFMKVTRDVHSFFQEESFKKEVISQYKPSVFEFPTGV